MDHPEIDKQELLKAYRDINHVNTFLGGNNITIDGILKLEKHHKSNTPLAITDVGCGDGETLKKCAEYALKNNKNWKLYGIDINPKTIELAKKNTASFPEINYKALDVFSQDFKNHQTDIFLFTLTLHHFKSNEIKRILENCIQTAKLGIVINDLERSNWAYQLFRLYGFFFLKSPIAKHDGLISILRGFKKTELESLTSHFSKVKHSINYKWAFRWQWILKKI